MNYWLAKFVLFRYCLQQTISPLTLAKQQKSQRKRARGKNMESTQQTDW
ncbi:MAG TPA: hypothetical protein PK563_13470 [Tenuifilaceae bacterium]|nr:hypothetical protein [Tenuifilaceae bacterium]